MKFYINKKFYFLLVLGGALSFASCSSDDDEIIEDPDEGEETPEVPGEDDETGAIARYVIAADDSENSYLVTSEDIYSGSVTPQGGNGEQIIGTPIWYFYKDIAAYSFVYRQGDPGTTQSFALNTDGNLTARNEIDLQVSIQSRGIVGDQLYAQFSSRNYENPVATFYTINGETQVVSGPFTVNTHDLAGNGEYAYVTDIAEYGDYVLLGFRTIKAGEDGGDNAFASDFNDHTYVGVFNRDLELQQIIEDSGRTGAIAGQQRSQGETGIELTEDGDVYVFSSAIDAPDVPSGILKINNGELAFDDDYFFNISEASGGYKLYRTYYVGEDTFVLQMFSEQDEASATPSVVRNQFAVVNVEEQTFNWVTGVPENIQSIGTPYLDEESHEAVFPIETNLYPALYIVDADDATMSKGVEVVAEGISAVGKLTAED